MVKTVEQMLSEEYCWYMLNEKDEWEFRASYCPNYPAARREKVLPPFPKKEDFLPVGTKVYLPAKRKNCVIENLLCCFEFWQPEQGWKIYYDLKWEGSGHTHGYFQRASFETL